MDTINAIAELCIKAEAAADKRRYDDSMTYWLKAANLADIKSGFIEKAMDMMIMMESSGTEGTEVEFPTKDSDSSADKLSN
jgi:hypothetical protein